MRDFGWSQDPRAAERHAYFIGRAISSSASKPPRSMRSGPILPSSGSSLRPDAMVFRSCSMLSLIHVTSQVPEIAGACLAALGHSCSRLKEQIPEFDRMIRAWHRSNKIESCGSMIVRASVRCWPRPWLAVSLTQRAFRSGRNFSAWIGAGAEAALRAGARHETAWRYRQAR